MKESCIPVLYVPCHYIDSLEKENLYHLKQVLQDTFTSNQTVALLTTAQHSAALRAFVDSAESERTTSQSEQSTHSLPHLFLPSNPPLPPGEFLGCTCPTFHHRDSNKSTSSTLPSSPSADAVVCYVDGRFHVDAALLANPDLPCFRFDTTQHTLTRETMDCKGLATLRRFVGETGNGIVLRELLLN